MRDRDNELTAWDRDHFFHPPPSMWAYMPAVKRRPAWSLVPRAAISPISTVERALMPSLTGLQLFHNAFDLPEGLDTIYRRADPRGSGYAHVRIPTRDGRVIQALTSQGLDCGN